MNKKSARIAAAIDFGGTGVKIALVNDRGAILARSEFETRSFAKPTSWIKEVARQISDLCRIAGVSPRSLTGAGVGAPGFVDHDHGVVLTLPNVPGWNRCRLADRLSSKLGMPVRVDNDVNAMALGESLHGAGRGVRHAVFLTLGTGVGGALILDGRLYRGAHGMAGEIGHVSIDADGEKTATGVGVLEQSIGNGPIVRYAQSLLRKGLRSQLSTAAELSVKDIAIAAKAGDAVATKVFDHVSICLASALAGVAYTLQPERFIIGGGVSQSGAVLFGPLRRHLAERLHPLFFRKISLVPARLGADAGLIGCSCLVLAPVVE
jgi:glucokinase